MDLETLNNLVIKSINAITEDFRRNKDLFLTEGDLECRLFRELQKNIPREEETRDRRHKTGYIHSQLRYFEGNRLDKNSVDIVVVPPSNFNFKKHQIVRRKGYYFEEPSIAIELKLNKRIKDPSALIRLWKSDLEKLMRLQRNRDMTKFFSMLLDKNNVFDDIENIKCQYPNIEIIYVK